MTRVIPFCLLAAISLEDIDSGQFPSTYALTRVWYDEVTDAVHFSDSKLPAPDGKIDVLEVKPIGSPSSDLILVNIQSEVGGKPVDNALLAKIASASVLGYKAGSLEQQYGAIMAAAAIPQCVPDFKSVLVRMNADGEVETFVFAEKLSFAQIGEHFGVRWGDGLLTVAKDEFLSAMELAMTADDTLEFDLLAVLGVTAFDVDIAGNQAIGQNFVFTRAIGETIYGFGNAGTIKISLLDETLSFDGTDERLVIPSMTHGAASLLVLDDTGAQIDEVMANRPIDELNIADLLASTPGTSDIVEAPAAAPVS